MSKSNLVACICLLMACCAFRTPAAAQSQTQYFLPQMFPRSPNATGLEKYGTYQVNEFTGVPDISIPLYTIEAGGIKVPITLSYHASGIKISDAASWAGLGWSVSSGGQISRRTMGLPDDGVYGYLNGHMRQPGTYNSTTMDGLQYMDSVAMNKADTKPDIFSYDFPGHGGKFFFDGSLGQNFAVRFVPFAPLKLTHNGYFYPYNYYYGPTYGLVNFTITDEHGTLYNFGGSGANETTFTEQGGGNPQTLVSAWKISSMVSQNRRDTVSFAYQVDTLSVPTSDSEIYTVIDEVNNLAAGVYSPSYSSAPAYIGNFASTTEELPQQISFRNGKVAFDVDSRTDIGGAYRLKDIKIYQFDYAAKAMVVQRTIVFYHSYFGVGASGRLRLDSIAVQDKAGSTVQRYRFDYNTTLTMPYYTSYAQDYWGYYNGCDGLPHNPANTMLTPLQTIVYNPNGIGPENVTIGQANRMPDSNYMQACVLTGIHYPTGGYTTFTYQTNQYVADGVTTLAGGLRIHTISSYDGVNPAPIVKTYVYNIARKNFFLDYAYFVASQTHRHYSLFHANTPYFDGSEVVRSFSSTPHCDLEAWDGATVVYPSVTEYIGTPGANVGRTDYTFTDMTDSYMDASLAGSLIYESAFYVRGHPLTKTEYIHKSDGSYQVVRADTNGYTAFPQRVYGAVGLVVRKMFYNEGFVGEPIPPGFATPDDEASFVPTPMYYDIFSGDMYLTGTVTKIYDTNDTTKYTTSAVSYAYDDTVHQQVVKTTHVDSRGNTHVTVNKYPYDYWQGTTTNNAVLDSMISRHMYGEVVEKWDSVENVTSHVNSVTGAQLNQFKAGSQPGSIVPAKISTLSVSSPVTNFTPSYVTGGVLTGDPRYVQMISFDQYDLENNIIQYTPRNATPTSIFWDDQYENPVAQVKNATIAAGSAYTGFEADARGNWNYGGTPVVDLTAPMGSYVYPLSTGSVSTIVSGSGAYTLSLWSNGGAPTVYAGSYLTGTALTSTGGWIYYEYQVPAGAGSVTVSGSASIDELRLYPATAQMITYAYAPDGVTAIGDAKGSISHFEYDYFHRLKNIKDFYGNIVNNYGYHTYDQTVGNQAQSASFTRNNCPYGTSPGSLSYNVPANKYYSSTLASANAEAVYDLNTNGQAKANQDCGCPILYINVTVTNSSGIASFPVTFSGLPTYYVPTGTSNISVPENSYTTVELGPLGSGTHNYSLGAFPPQNGVHYAVFNNVQVVTGPTLNISIN